MLSVDKFSHDRNIYILQKTVPTVNRPEEKVAAHLQSGKRNSVILDKYRIVKEYVEFPGDARYRVKRISSNTKLDGYELTQQDCLQLAMRDYCARNNYNILYTL